MKNNATKTLTSYTRANPISPEVADLLARYFDATEYAKAQRLLRTLFVKPRKEREKWAKIGDKINYSLERASLLTDAIRDGLYPNWREIGAKRRAEKDKGLSK